MEVILLERVEKLGQMGSVVRVKDGYARNYLLPRRKALRATKESRKRFEAQRAQLEAANLERRKEAEAVAEQMQGLTVTVLRQAGDSGQLYGSVSARDIADVVGEAGFTVDRRQVQINDRFKTLGLHKVQINLHPEVSVEVTVNGARTEQEARIQAAGGTVGLEAEDEEEALEEAPSTEEVFEEAPSSSAEPEETGEERPESST